MYRSISWIVCGLNMGAEGDKELTLQDGLCHLQGGRVTAKELRADSTVRCSVTPRGSSMELSLPLPPAPQEQIWLSPLICKRVSLT